MQRTERRLGGGSLEILTDPLGSVLRWSGRRCRARRSCCDSPPILSGRCSGRWSCATAGIPDVAILAVPLGSVLHLVPENNVRPWYEVAMLTDPEGSVLLAGVAAVGAADPVVAILTDPEGSVLPRGS